jgi:hypothetical protein
MRIEWTNRVWLAIALLAMAPAFAAGSLDGPFDVRSAYVVFDRGVGQLSAQVQYPLSDDVREALNDGVTLDFDLDVVINKPRRFWFDANVIDLHLRRELSYHAVSDRYVLRDDDGTELQSFPTVEAAVEQLSHIESLPVVLESQLPGNGPWEINVRADIRRGRLPAALRALVFWSDDWYRSSDWYTWTLDR